MKKYSMSWENEKLTISFYGIVTLVDIFQVCDERVGDERFDSVKYILNDFSKAEAIEINEKGLNAAQVYSSQSHLFGNRDGLVAAFVVNDEEMERKIISYIDITQSEPRRCKELFLGR
jgi:hypothetical protein